MGIRYKDAIKVELVIAVDRHGRITDVYDDPDPDREAVEGVLLYTFPNGITQEVTFQRTARVSLPV